MRAYYFTEQAYPYAWDDHQGSLRVTLPNRKIDPRRAADLFHRYYDEWQIADELGLDIMVNEHHSTATCMSSTVIVGLSVLARETKRARILVLGYPIGHRMDPLRMAEELATIDVISRGRLDMGFIKGIPFEVAVANQNPVNLMSRFWEAHDFIIKAMTSHDEPFNWESENFHYRHVNIWPRPWQDPHPPIWSTTGSRSQAAELGKRGYVLATLGSGYTTRPLYDTYRRAYMAAGRPAPYRDRFGYLGLVAVAHNEAEAKRRGELIAGYLRTSGIVAPPFRNPPGWLSVEDNARILRGERPSHLFNRAGKPVDQRTATVEELTDAGIMFCGTPDQVYRQLIEFCDYCGGMGNLLMMGQAGFLSHEDTVDNLTLFAREVLPRLREYKQKVATEVAPVTAPREMAGVAQ